MNSFFDEVVLPMIFVLAFGAVLVIGGVLGQDSVTKHALKVTAEEITVVRDGKQFTIAPGTVVMVVDPATKPQTDSQLIEKK